MFSIAEWTDRASALSYPKKLTSSASFSPSIRISLRLKIHQAQAKNFCRVLDIRVAQIVKANPAQTILFQQLRKACRHGIRLDQISHCIHKYIAKVLLIIAVAANFLVVFLLLFDGF